MTDDLDLRIAETARLLLAAAVEQGHTVTGDMRIGERAAAHLLGYSDPGCLKNARHEGRAPPAYRLGRSVSYRIHDLAAWIEAGRESW
jgi:hypothetical protein